jgi:hypothetical protein
LPPAAQYFFFVFSFSSCRFEHICFIFRLFSVTIGTFLFQKALCVFMIFYFITTFRLFDSILSFAVLLVHVNEAPRYNMDSLWVPMKQYGWIGCPKDFIDHTWGHAFKIWIHSVLIWDYIREAAFSWRTLSSSRDRCSNEMVKHDVINLSNSSRINSISGGWSTLVNTKGARDRIFPASFGRFLDWAAFSCFCPKIRTCCSLMPGNAAILQNLR